MEEKGGIHIKHCRKTQKAAKAPQEYCTIWHGNDVKPAPRQPRDTQKLLSGEKIALQGK